MSRHLLMYSSRYKSQSVEQKFNLISKENRKLPVQSLPQTNKTQFGHLKTFWKFFVFFTLSREHDDTRNVACSLAVCHHLFLLTFSHFLSLEFINRGGQCCESIRKYFIVNRYYSWYWILWDVKSFVFWIYIEQWNFAGFL